MRRLIFALLLLSATPVLADNFIFTNQQAIQVLAGLRGLDGYDDQIDGKPVHKQYDLKMSTRLVIAHDIAILMPVAQAYQSAQNGATCQAFPLTCKVPVDAQGKESVPKAFYDEIDKAVNGPTAPAQLDLTPLATADLGEKNPIPPSVIANLLPILKDGK